MMLAVAALALALDQATKAWVTSNMLSHDIRPVIEGVIRLRYTENTGAAFGLFQGGTIALSIAAVAISCTVGGRPSDCSRSSRSLRRLKPSSRRRRGA